MKKLSSLLFLGAFLLPSLGTTFYAECSSSSEQENLEYITKDETTLDEPNVKLKARRPLKRTGKGGKITRPTEKQYESGIQSEGCIVEESNVRLKPRRPLKRTGKGGPITRPTERTSELGIQADNSVMEGSNIRLKPRRSLKRTGKGGPITRPTKKSESQINNVAEIESDRLIKQESTDKIESVEGIN